MVGPSETMPEMVGQVVEAYKESILEAFLDHGSCGATLLAVIESTEDESTSHLSLMVMDEAFDQDEYGAVKGNSDRIELICKAVKKVDGKLALLAVATDGLVGELTDETTKAQDAVFFAFQAVDGNTGAHIYIANDKDDKSGYFSEFKKAPKVVSAAAERVVGLVWKDYLTMRAINSN